MEIAVSPAATRVANLLLESGALTATQLAEQLGLTGTAVRKHLDALVAAGWAEASERAPYGPTRPRGRGRPAKVYSLTAGGRENFTAAYDELAAAAIRQLEVLGGAEAVTQFARQRSADMVSRYADKVDLTASTEQRVEQLAQLLREDGFAATLDPATNGIQLCQHHCPVAHVAEQFPQLCDAETEAFGDVLGTHVTRLATIAHGDCVCTTHVAVTDGASAEKKERTTA